MNNKVFYQHPNLMRVLGMHETVMEVMVNVLGAEKSQVMLQGEFVSNLTPAHGWCPLPSDSSRGGHGEEQGDGTQPVLTVLTHFTGLLSLLPILFCSPAPSKMEFLRVPLRSLVCLVLCQKAVLKENRILMERATGTPISPPSWCMTLSNFLTSLTPSSLTYEIRIQTFLLQNPLQPKSIKNAPFVQQSWF